MSMRSEYMPIEPQFEPFLFSEIGEEENGMPLTVISALARFGVDPWEEAARLAALPRTAALEAMIGLLARLPSGEWRTGDRARIARRLLDLLPVPAAPSVRRVARNRPREVTAKWLVLVLLAGLVLAYAHWHTPLLWTPPAIETNSRR